MRDLCAIHEVRETENVGPAVFELVGGSADQGSIPEWGTGFSGRKNQFLGLATNVNLVYGELRVCDSSRSRGVSDGSPVDPLTTVFTFTRGATARGNGE